MTQPHGLDPHWLRKSRAHVSGLTGRYRRAVVAYTTEDHKRINDWLRRGQRPADGYSAARTRDLDAILRRNPLTRTTTLTRTIDLSTFKVATGASLERLTGTLRTEMGFLSTSRLPSGGETKFYTNPVRISVVAPAGTPAAAIEDISIFSGQGEVLLARGLSYFLRPPAYDDAIGMWHVVMEIA